MAGFVTKRTDALRSKVYDCTTCGLYKECVSPRINPYGNFKKQIMVIGEAPGEHEDRKGMPWQGRTGHLLQSRLRELGISLFEDCVNINSIRCRPMDKGRNRAPTNPEISACRRFVLKAIEQYKPKVILILGNSPLFSIMGHRWVRDLGTMTKWRGWGIPDQDFNCWIVPTFHPSYVERAMEERMQEVNTVWVQDLKKAIELSVTPLPVYPEPVIDMIDHWDPLYDITAPYVAVDFETTGLKPHAEGHKIICAAVADSEDHAYVGMVSDVVAERRPLVSLLGSAKVGKIAQNMKFEDSWAYVRLNITVQNWIWDTMLAAHVLDNRRGATHLKFQVYVNFGVIDYSSAVDPYLKPKGADSSNSINQIEALVTSPGGIPTLLKYCALDAIYELRLANKQRKLILPNDNKS